MGNSEQTAAVIWGRKEVPPGQAAGCRTETLLLRPKIAQSRAGPRLMPSSHVINRPGRGNQYLPKYFSDKVPFVRRAVCVEWPGPCVRLSCSCKHFLKANCTRRKFGGCRDPWSRLSGTFSHAGLEGGERRITQGFWGPSLLFFFFFFFTKHSDRDTHRHSKTGLRNLRGQLCMTQGLTSNGSPGKVVCCIVCWFVGRSSGGCHGDCLHFLSVAAHIKGRVLVSIIVTNWILHFPRTHVTNLQQSERMSARTRACVSVCLSVRPPACLSVRRRVLRHVWWKAT